MHQRLWSREENREPPFRRAKPGNGHPLRAFMYLWNCFDHTYRIITSRRSLAHRVKLLPLLQLAPPLLLPDLCLGTFGTLGSGCEHAKGADPGSSWYPIAQVIFESFQPKYQGIKNETQLGTKSAWSLVLCYAFPLAQQYTSFLVFCWQSKAGKVKLCRSISWIVQLFRLITPNNWLIPTSYKSRFSSRYKSLFTGDYNPGLLRRTELIRSACVL
jgi:hypothetical protein